MFSFFKKTCNYMYSTVQYMIRICNVIPKNPALLWIHIYEKFSKSAENLLNFFSIVWVSLFSKRMQLDWFAFSFGSCHHVVFECNCFWKLSMKLIALLSKDTNLHFPKTFVSGILTVNNNESTPLWKGESSKSLN